MNYYRADYLLSQDENFDFNLINNLINGLPALIFLSNHAIIADGYNTDGYYHLNFGWCNGDPDYITDTWYKPEALPKNYEGFYSGILNIQPVDFDYHPEITSSIGHIKLSCSKIGEESKDESFTLKNTGRIPVYIDDLLISENFNISLSDVNNDVHVQPDKKICLQPDEELKLHVWCLPDTLGHINGKLQIFSSYKEVKNINLFI